MDANTSRSIHKSDQTPWRSNDIDHRIDSQGHVRSYACNFCKRGFSNAQALGGHMNIHRKDRAKLRQLSEDEDEGHNQEVSLSLDLNEQNLHASDEEKHCIDKKLGFQIHESKLDTSEKVTELPFVIGLALPGNNKRSEQEGSRSSCEDKEEKSQVMEGLDLELRLGQSFKNL